MLRTVLSSSVVYGLSLYMRCRFTLPRLHASYGSSGCSPHGFVAVILPSAGVGLLSSSLSRNTTPGSPFFHACCTMSSKTSLARRVPAGCLVLGLISSYSVSSATACMNASVMPTEMLKFESAALSTLQVMKDSISGWSTRRMPMLAPRLLPPCLIVSVAALKTVMNDTGPDATPPVDLTTSP